MFIEFKTKDNATILLNTQHVVSIELPQPLAGLQGGAQQLRIHCLEGRVYILDPKQIKIEDLLAQIESRELDIDGKDKNSPIT